MTAAAGGGGLDLQNLLTPLWNAGVIGVVAIMLTVRKYVVPEWVLRKLEEEIQELHASYRAQLEELKRANEAKEQSLRESHELMTREVVPLVTRSTLVLERVLQAERGTDGGRRDEPMDRPERNARVRRDR